MEAAVKIVHETIKAESEFLNSISQDIWKHPELKYEEKYAHERLVNVLKDKGFKVTPQYVTPTAFRAEFSSGSGPTIAVMCEYDALPDVGHACGHNLIAESGIAVGLVVKAALEANIGVQGKIIVLGTPAEEGGGGKIKLINNGAFKDIDAAIMSHPSVSDHLFPPFISCGRLTVTYTGKEAHACGYPWEGVNALDAAVASYNSISMLRQHIKPLCRLHGVITNGGNVPNVIPGLTAVRYMYRAPTLKDYKNLEERVVACCKSAATATGCDVDIVFDVDAIYKPIIHNKAMCSIYKKYGEQLGVEFQDSNHKATPFMASSDMGNVSYEVPSIHPTYSIGTTAGNHSSEYAVAAGKPEAQKPTLISSECMALVALQLMYDPKTLEEVKKQFKEDLAADEY